MSAHPVAAPTRGTVSAVNTAPLACTGMYVLSWCQPSLPRSDLTTSSDGSACTLPSRPMLEIGAASNSRSPKRRAKSFCSSRDRNCPGKISNPCSSQAAWSAAQVSSSSVANRTPVTVAPNVASSGSTSNVVVPMRAA